MKAIGLLAALLLCLLNGSVWAVNVNTASSEELAKELEGVGPAKAEAIVQYRTEKGGFKTLQDLAEVKGIGAATLEKNKDKIEF